MSPLDVCALRLTGQKLIHFGSRPIVGHDGETVVIHVEDQILTHDCQTNQCDVSGGVAHAFSLVEGARYRSP